jgi:hypothetical protein
MARVEMTAPLSDRLSERIFNRVHQDIGQASMCWKETPHGVFDSEQAGDIAFNLCHYIADELDVYRETLRKVDEALRLTQEYAKLPNLPGWSHYDARRLIAQVLARE